MPALKHPNFKALETHLPLTTPYRFGGCVHDGSFMHAPTIPGFVLMSFFGALGCMPPTRTSCTVDETSFWQLVSSMTAAVKSAALSNLWARGGETGKRWRVRPTNAIPVNKMVQNLFSCSWA